MTWGWVTNVRAFILEWTVLLSFGSSPPEWQWEVTCYLNSHFTDGLWLDGFMCCIVWMAHLYGSELIRLQAVSHRAHSACLTIPGHELFTYESREPCAAGNWRSQYRLCIWPAERMTSQKSWPRRRERGLRGSFQKPREIKRSLKKKQEYISV